MLVDASSLKTGAVLKEKIYPVAYTQHLTRLHNTIYTHSRSYTYVVAKELQFSAACIATHFSLHYPTRDLLRDIAK